MKQTLDRIGMSSGADSGPDWDESDSGKDWDGADSRQDWDRADPGT